MIQQRTPNLDRETKLEFGRERKYGFFFSIFELFCTAIAFVSFLGILLFVSVFVLSAYQDHKAKLVKQVKKLTKRGLLDPEKVNEFSHFVGTTGITYCLYRDSDRILGNTFGIFMLQDFEALTPNLLARTIETIEGGGLIVLLLRTLSSLTSLYTMAMDVHERFRTESHSQTTGRFNERFLLSLASCKACIVVDDELNILPIYSHVKTITQLPVQEVSDSERELENLKEQLNDDFPVGPLREKLLLRSLMQFRTRTSVAQ